MQALVRIGLADQLDLPARVLSQGQRRRVGLARLFLANRRLLWILDEPFTALDVGGVLINNVPTFRVENMPYGGVKDSGFGREGIRYAMEEMTEVKSLIVKSG